MVETNRRLMFHGMCLFLLGLLTGFAEQHFANVRMGLAAHLEGLNEWDLSDCIGSYLALSEAFTSKDDIRILDPPLWNIRELVHHDPCCNLRDCGPISNYRSRS